MERCPADIQRIILGYVCLSEEDRYRICELRQLVRVNHMFRKWAISYILFDYKSNDKILEHISTYYSILESDAIEFDIIGYLRDDQWKHQPGMFASFNMFLDAISPPRLISPPEILLYGKANEMFTIDMDYFDHLQRRKYIRRKINNFENEMHVIIHPFGGEQTVMGRNIKDMDVRKRRLEKDFERLAEHVKKQKE